MADVIKVTLVNRVPNSVTVSTGVSGGGTWGTISGTITDQSDLVTYVTSERPNYPVVSPDGTSFIIVAGNDGTLAAIPTTSTAPSITTLPTISGTLEVGVTLTATAGNVSGDPTPTRVLQWQRSDNGTTGWVDISGATGTTYLLGFNDEDKYIRVAQTEENILGTATANSASTGQIQPAPSTFLLDLYPNASAAYSLRKLSVFYSGDAIIVRRASDNVTQSIGFVSNQLDIASLESFCAGTDGFVTTWFDQSGNGVDNTNANASSQPKIVSSGSTILENGKPTIQWVQDTDILNAITNVSISNNLTFIAVNAANINGSAASDGAIAQYNQDSANHISIGYRDGGYFTRLYKNSSVNGINGYDFSSTSLNLVFDYIDYTNVSNEIYVDNVSGSDANGGRSSISGNSSITIGNRVGGGSFSPQCAISEMIFYESDQSSNRSGIQTNINAFYNIY